LGEGVVLSHSGHEYLALVDVESYPSFVAKDVDHLDMMAHLYGQMKALTAVAWGAPGKMLNTRFVLTENDRTADHITYSECRTTASGWLRTNGRVCFTSHDRLFDCAHHRTHDVLREQLLPKNSRPHVLAVPPGIYAVQVFYHLPYPYGGGIESVPSTKPKIHFTVILRHYAFPAPRTAPVRLPGLIPWASASGADASIPWGGLVSHHAD
jgi:hypothetical protein